MAEKMEPHIELLQKHSKALIEKMDVKELDILDLFLQNETIDKDKYDEIRNHKERKEQNTAFLNLMEQKTEKEFDEFKESLQNKENHKDLFKLLSESENNKTRSIGVQWNDSENGHREIIRKYREELIEKIDVARLDILDLLFRNEAYNREEYDKIRAFEDKREQNICFVEMMETKSEDTFNEFKESVKHKDEELYDLLNDKQSTNVGSKSIISLKRDLEDEQKKSKDVHNTNHPKIVKNVEEIANNHYCQYNQKKAIGYYKEAIKMWKAIEGDHSQDISRCLKRLSISFFRSKRYEESLEVDLEILEMKKQEFEEDSPEIALTLGNMAVTCEKMEDIKSAITYHEKSLDIKRKHLENNPSSKEETDSLLSTLKRLGDIHFEMMEHEKALEYYEEYVKISKETYGEKVVNEDIADCLSNLGVSYKKTQDYDKAIESHKESAIMLSKLYGNRK